MFITTVVFVFFRRVIPGGAEDIGTWLTIFQTISYAAVISNAGLICFTMELVTIPQADKIWVFIAFQYVLLMAMSLFAYIVDDVPADVSIVTYCTECIHA